VTAADNLTATHFTATADAPPDMRRRLIDHWFPCAAVDAAVETPAGSGLTEKALFTWFASRPIAQARAAVLTTLLPDRPDLHREVIDAVSQGSRAALQRLRDAIENEYPSGRPVVLDIFSGRGIIPLEAARLSATAIGTDLSPVATLAGCLLADYPLRDWSAEPPLPFQGLTDDVHHLFGSASEPRLVADLRLLLTEIGRRVRDRLDTYFPRNAAGAYPWGYLWATTIPCDQCKRRFPLLSTLALRHPYERTEDTGQAICLETRDTTWVISIVDGIPTQEPTFTAAAGRRGKSARCLFCKHVHALDAVKSKGFAGQFEDTLIAVADGGDDTARKTFRVPTELDRQAAEATSLHFLADVAGMPPIPDERIPPGNGDTIRASGYGFETYGSLMCNRQAVQFATTAEVIRECWHELRAAGVSDGYAAALTAYAAGNLVRRLRYATRGARLQAMGNASATKQNRNKVGDLFVNESQVSFGFDFFETGLGGGSGTWASISEIGLKSLLKVIAGNGDARPGRFRRASAVALPFRDATVDAVVTDPPYYKMIDYLDASDLFFVWLKRCLVEVFPDLFAGRGLQDKTEEIIVKRGNAPGEHRTKDFYERTLSRAFGEARRVLRPDGHLVVVFGHSDPDAWRRLLAALHEARFIVTSAWPSRTETANTGVASIKVTVTISCRVAEDDRPVATAAQVDREVVQAVRSAVPEWDRDGLALTDQLMAAYGPAMQVYGRYSKILKPSGSPAELDRYLTLARTAVRDATALRLDELPLETFDAATRFAVFWQRLYGRADVPKGEARFLAQADNLRIEDMRGPLLTESKSGFKLRLDAPDHVTERSSTFEVARAVAAAWHQGATEAVAAVIAAADRQPTDAHLWAVVGEIVRQVPASDPVAKALTAVQRNVATIAALVQHAASLQQRAEGQMMLDFTYEE
jgi:putative DNA methylase